MHRHLKSQIPKIGQGLNCDFIVFTAVKSELQSHSENRVTCTRYVCVYFTSYPPGKYCINDSPGVDILLGKEINNGIHHVSCLLC